MSIKEKKKLFREKNIEKLNSPEALNDYLHVTSPGVWVCLGAVIILLIGAIIWIAFAKIDTTTTVAVEVTEDGCVCYVPTDKVDEVVEYKKITIEDKDYKINPTVLKAMTVTDDMDINVMMAGNLTIGTYVYPVEVEASDLSVGAYEGKIFTGTISPSSFFIN